MTHEIVDNPLTEADIVTSETPMNVQTDPPSKKRKNAQDPEVSLLSNSISRRSDIYH